MTGFEDLQIFDTTLRDGEQMPQLAFSVQNKLSIAKKLDELGVQVIEAGFPVNSAEEREASRIIAAEVSAKVCGCARVVPKDIEACHEGDCDMVDLICSTSDIQLKNSQNMDRGQVVEVTRECVRRVKDLGMSCMFTPMDSTRTDLDFLVEVCQLAREEGADLIGLTDTVGVGRPDTIEKMVRKVAGAVPIPVSIHCHNDFGLAVANTISGILAGAKMFQVCLNGLGERAGNASLEETVMALKSLYNIDCGIDTQKLYGASRLLERLSGVGLPPNKAVVGQNAFAHESGIHAAGMTRDAATFEPGLMTPEMVGHTRRLVVGKHTGKHGIAQVLADAGLALNESELKDIMQRVREMASKGKSVTTTDLFAMAETVMQKVPPDMRTIVVEQLVVTTGDRIAPTASVRATVNGEERIEAHTGVGPVDAAFGAVKRMVDDQTKLEIAEFHVDAITGGSNATVKVTVTIEDDDGKRFSANASNADIVVASMDALITATNHMIRRRKSNGGGEKTATA